MLFVSFVVEGANDAEAGEVFASEESGFIDEFLVDFELWEGEAEDEHAEKDDGTDAGGDSPG